MEEIGGQIFSMKRVSSRVGRYTSLLQHVIIERVVIIERHLSLLVKGT